MFHTRIRYGDFTPNTLDPYLLQSYCAMEIRHERRYFNLKKTISIPSQYLKRLILRVYSRFGGEIVLRISADFPTLN